MRVAAAYTPACAPPIWRLIILVRANRGCRVTAPAATLVSEPRPGTAERAP